VANRLPNPRKAKIHRSYTVEEVSRLYEVHRNTVRHWIAEGLPVCDDRRPTLILGPALVEFLTQKRAKNKRPCGPGQIYCVACRVPQRPAEAMAEYQPLTATSGNLVGFCPQCERMIFRRVSFAKLDAVKGDLDVRVTHAREHIVEIAVPTVNCDSSRGD
jgi:hypothetical protein